MKNENKIENKAIKQLFEKIIATTNELDNNSRYVKLDVRYNKRKFIDTLQKIGFTDNMINILVEKTTYIWIENMLNRVETFNCYTHIRSTDFNVDCLLSDLKYQIIGAVPISIHNKQNSLDKYLWYIDVFKTFDKHKYPELVEVHNTYNSHPNKTLYIWTIVDGDLSV